MMNNKRWAVIMGNGYNSANGIAKLFILYLDADLSNGWTAGSDYIVLSTGVGGADCSTTSVNCNGLSSPQIADVNSDQVVDRIYAGDLKGNMWVFDVSDKTNTSNWNVAYSGKPLFKAGKPITQRPTIVTNPLTPTGAAPNLLVLFGTGQYLTLNDISTTDTQAFYGVWDHGKDSLTSSNLVQQTYLTGTFTSANTSATVSNFATLTNNTVDYSNKDGWFISLTNNTGERSIVDSDVVDNILFFNTWVPTSLACKSGGTGVLNSVDVGTGGRPSFSVFSLSGASVITSKDTLTQNGANYTVTSEKFNDGLPSSSGFMPNNQYTTGTNAGKKIYRRNICTGSSCNPGSNMKRISWHEIK
jgi:type IV pilus assembly protein PilY1